ncbi:hypothetical protein GCM10010276_12410 [Streptomyces longisporus]|uniref:Lipoprotein n=1 Tax=Streptomyces longisporus TaxID=1948 RepID=A0ABP5YA00_STRLO
MNRPGHFVACVLVAAAPLFALGGCGVPDQVDSQCANSSCTVHVHSGTSVDVKGIRLNVKEVSDDYVTLSSHGMSLQLSKKLDLKLGSHTLRLVQTGGGTAEIQIK